MSTVAQRRAFAEASRGLAEELGQLPRRHSVTYEVPSDRLPGVTYKVLIGPSGEGVCTCPDFERRNRECKHIRKVKEKSMSNESMALVPIKVLPPANPLPTNDELKIIGVIAKSAVLAAGHAVPSHINSTGKAFAVMLAGWELGAKPMTALRHIAVVNGRTEPDAQLMMGVVLSKEPDARFTVLTESETETTMRFERPSRGLKVEFTYSDADAKAAGLLGKSGPWTQHKKLMRTYACAKRLCRVYAPDLINSIGVGVADVAEALLDEVEDDPRIIDSSSIPPHQLYSEGDDTTAPVEEPDCEHSPVFNEDTTLMVCEKCGTVLEEPAVEQPSLV